MLPTGVSSLVFSVGEAQAVTDGARAYRAACVHGVSSGLLLPGAKSLADAVAMDLVAAGHRSKFGCHCPQAMPLDAADDARH